MFSYAEKKRQTLQLFQEVKKSKGVSLKPKKNTHFLRRRSKPNPLNLLAFNQVINVNTKEKYVEVEGLACFYDIVNQTLPHGYMPAVVPELRSITIGGAISGLGVEASSFKYGLVHENVVEIDVLTGNGDVVTVSEKQHRDLFVTLPNSLGTLGYVLKCKMNLIPVKKYVRVEFLRYNTAKECFAAMEKIASEQEIDFLEGVVFDPQHFVLVCGTFTDHLPATERLYDVYNQAWYRYVADIDHSHAYLTVKSFLWRWDPDVYWGTDQKGLLGKVLNNALLRHTVLKPLLRSDYLIRFRQSLRYHPFLSEMRASFSEREEQLVQDAGVDIGKCSEFFLWYKKEIAIYPIWLCPVKESKELNRYPLNPSQGKFVVDIGFYSSKKLAKDMSDNYYNNLIEKKLIKLDAVKGLYSTSFYTWNDFWKIYDGKSYFSVKKKYDSENVFPNLYEKVAGNQTK